MDWLDDIGGEMQKYLLSFTEKKLSNFVMDGPNKRGEKNVEFSKNKGIKGTNQKRKQKCS